MIPPAPPLNVVRGEPIEIEFEAVDDLGSPSPTLTFTLATTRNNPTKLYTTTVDALAGSPLLYRVTLDSDATDVTVRTYWWDVWRTDTPQLLAYGSLDVLACVRLP